MNLLSLVSEQPIPNIIISLQLKPEKTILVSTREQKEVAKRIKAVLENNGLKVLIHSSFADAYNFSSAKDLYREVIKNYKIDVLNLTGGTKIMSLAAYEVFSEENVEIVYCDTLHRKVLSLTKDDSWDFTVNINIRDYLKAYGYKTEEARNNIESHKEEFFKFVQKNNFYESFVQFSRIVREKVRLDETNKSCGKGDWQYNKNFDKLTLVHSPSKNKFVFEEPKFIHGQWLEEITFWEVMMLKDELGLEDIAFNIKILSIENLQNEIDVAFTKNCKLFIISCKSGMKDENHALYELETLRHLAGGTFGNAYNVITRSPSDNYIKRASELGIKLIKISELNKYSFI